MTQHPSLSDGQRRLLAALHLKPDGPTRRDLERRTAAGEFDDFVSDHPAPCVHLVAELTSAGFDDLARAAMEGRFDAGHEYAERWASSPSGQRALAKIGGR